MKPIYFLSITLTNWKWLRMLVNKLSQSHEVKKVDLHATGHVPGLWIRKWPASRWLRVNKIGSGAPNKRPRTSSPNVEEVADFSLTRVLHKKIPQEPTGCTVTCPANQMKPLPIVALQWPGKVFQKGSMNWPSQQGVSTCTANLSHRCTVTKRPTFQINCHLIDIPM